MSRIKSLLNLHAKIKDKIENLKQDNVKAEYAAYTCDSGKPSIRIRIQKVRITQIKSSEVYRFRIDLDTYSNLSKTWINTEFDNLGGDSAFEAACVCMEMIRKNYPSAVADGYEIPNYSWKTLTADISG